MTVAFLDGVDGSGKTTLLDRLAHALAPGRAVTALPLWRFLPALATPADFTPWVTSTDATHIAAALLTGQTRRLQTIENLGRDAGNRVVVLVDRGPATVVASARAHLRTGIQTGHHQAIDLADHVGRLRDAVERLAAETACLSIELQVIGSPDQILDRLTAEERADPGYLRYLRALHREFTTFIDRVPAWAGLHRVRLDATQPVDANVSGALNAVRAVLDGRVPG
ncbi:MAG: hypothetical protein HKP61_07075 [Dactylosporangium sp.]|nr:ATP-binding protein [Dactylosporangium sp.]NNJ60706.1 hypothetical protein [Dactylosporangium sp.]